MKNYFVRKTENDERFPDNQQWQEIAPLHIDYFMWKCENKPETTVKLLCSEEALFLRFETDERPLIAEELRENGDVFADSCMEFFLQPDKDDARYFNFEINPLGTLHLGLGDSRENRILLAGKKNLLELVSCITTDKWILQYRIPFSLLLEYVNNISPVIRANFYKCNEHPGQVHFASWNKIENDTPDFHRPEYFGNITLENRE